MISDETRKLRLATVHRGQFAGHISHVHPHVRASRSAASGSGLAGSRSFIAAVTRPDLSRPWEMRTSGHQTPNKHHLGLVAWTSSRLCQHRSRSRPSSNLLSPPWAYLPLFSTMHSLFLAALLLVPSFTMALKIPVRQIRRDAPSNNVNTLKSFNNFAVMDQYNTIT